MKKLISLLLAVLMLAALLREGLDHAHTVDILLHMAGEL